MSSGSSRKSGRRGWPRGGRSSRPSAEPLIGCKNLHPTDNSYKNQRSRHQNRSLLPNGSSRLADEAWRLFGTTPPGWARVQTICDFVHDHITFGYEHSRATRTAVEAYAEQRGVCRDYAIWRSPSCRCLNIPARYCAGYVSDIGLPPPYAPMDFAAWIEVFLGGRWHTFDPRNNDPRIGRILIARGREAADVPLTLTFGPNTLVGFKVVTEEVQA